MKSKLVIYSILIVLTFISCKKDIVPFRDSSLSIETRIDDLMSRLTLDEKIKLLAGSGTFTTQPIERLGIPAMAMTDGPLGPKLQITSRGVEHRGKATNFSAPIAMAATWNDSLIEVVGKAIGAETRAKNFDGILAPCVNIIRVPKGGRSFESFSEDPYLTSRMGVAYVKGVQSQGVFATTKHFVANNQEKYRQLASSNVSERALHEIYFPGFKAAIQEGKTLAIMSSYNRINGTYASENKYLLTDILKNKWKFDGLVMSDWGSLHSTVDAANAGLDLEMPSAYYFGEKLADAVKNNLVDQKTIDDKVRRILRIMFKVGLLNETPKVYPTTIDTIKYQALALKVAQEGMVLLKNSGNLLPINRNSLKSIAVIGPNANEAIITAGGSGYIEAYQAVSPLDGIRKKVGDKIKVKFAKGARRYRHVLPSIPVEYLTPSKGEGHGLLGEYFSNPDLKGKPVVTRIDSVISFDWKLGGPAENMAGDNFSARWTGFLTAHETGNYEIGVTSDDGFRLYINDKLLMDDWTAHVPRKHVKTISLKRGEPIKIRFEYFELGGEAIAKLGIEHLTEKKDLDDAVALAKKSDVAVLCLGLNEDFEGEGKDRKMLNLLPEQEKLINAVSAVNPKTIVVLNNGTPVTMSHWLKNVPAVIEAWYTGQQTGTALADILFGDVNPSGKLPMTFPTSWKKSPVAKTYPGTKDAADYKEGIFVGYRYYDKKHIQPLFPFGYGLSYTNFEYSGLEVNSVSIKESDKITVKLFVKNTGSYTGDDIVQLYIHQVNPSFERPPKELKAYKKVHLQPGQMKKITLTLPAKDMSYYNPEKNGWVLGKGDYEILIGKSSRDIVLSGRVAVQ